MPTKTKKKTTRAMHTRTSSKAKKKTAKKVLETTTTPKRRRITKKRVLRHAKKYFWKYLSIVLLVIIGWQLLYTHSFAFKQGVLKFTEWLGVSRQTYDFEGHRIFEVNGITYVAYDHPLVTARILFDSTCESEFCNLDNLKEQILTNLTPAINFQKIDVTTGEGLLLAEQAGVKAVPSFIFTQDVKRIGNFEFIEDFFVERSGLLVLKTPPGKFITTPHNETAHVKGAKNPKVIITEFSSFTCAFCKEFNDVLTSLMNSYGDVLQIRYVHFNRGGTDQDLIHISECAAEQDKFWEMHDRLFENQGIFINEDGEFNFELIAEIALELDLDETSFAKCINDEKRFASKLQKMQKVAADYGIQAAPSFFINEFFNEGNLEERAMRDLIDGELAE